MFKGKRINNLVDAIPLIDKYLLALALAQVDIYLNKWPGQIHFALFLDEVQILLTGLSVIHNLLNYSGVLYIVFVSLTLGEIEVVARSILVFWLKALSLHSLDGVIVNYVFLVALFEPLLRFLGIFIFACIIEKLNFGELI